MFYLCELLITQQRYAEAVNYNQREIEAAAKANSSESTYRAQLIRIRLQHARQQLDYEKAISDLKHFKQTFPEPRQQWRIQGVLTEIDPSEQNRQDLIAMCRAYYERGYFAECRVRYESLTQQKLPTPPPLPTLPDVSKYILTDDSSLLMTRIDQLLAAKSK